MISSVTQHWSRVASGHHLVPEATISMQFALQHIKLILKGTGPGHPTLLPGATVFTTFTKMIPLCVLSIVRANILLLVGAGNLRPVVQLPWSHAADPQTAGLGWAGATCHPPPASADLGHHSSNVSN